MPLKTEVNLKVPYFSQLDNRNNPYGSCNVTSIAMCLHFFGIRGNGDGQLEDQIYKKMHQMGLSRHSPDDLAYMVKLYKRKDDFIPDAKWGDVKRWLDAGNPCVVHGWFTESGHIIVIKGYNDRGFIVHDPYGEYFDGGYDTSVSGADLTYSYDLMRELCGSDGDLWIHYISN